MVNSSPDTPLSFSVSLVRRASVQSRLREGGPKNSNHYNLKRFSQDFSQPSPNGLLWYGKASENYEVQLQVSSLPQRRSSLHRRLSQIITPSTKPWRDDGSTLEEFQTSSNKLQDTTTWGSDGRGEVMHDNSSDDTTWLTRPSSRASVNHLTWNLPNTRFCVAKDQVEINYINNNNHQQFSYPQLPLPRLSESDRRSVANPSRVVSFVAPESRLSISSIYSHTTESSLTLELTDEMASPPVRHLSAARDIDIRSRGQYGEEQAIAKDQKSRTRPLKQCLRRAKQSTWLDKAGKRLHSFLHKACRTQSSPPWP
ncbi:hypothetical protein PTTG_03209 [Puccinia triticina 1-1 BBBD Race 1]|uniref:Uncharacterized protein n=1 Tax=Puccinia triticina (isolate 1-1 / race 1 (BBBD)) TaxID=630390 RepID=A0A180GTC8_PUCT1|nr:hypothetical protein PTTG_03209 [Puccinia triticina 1-1 BBBD Race 1]